MNTANLALLEHMARKHFHGGLNPGLHSAFAPAHTLCVLNCKSWCDCSYIGSSLCSAAEGWGQRGGWGGWGASRRPISSGLCPQEPGAGIPTGLHRGVQGTTHTPAPNTPPFLHLLWKMTWYWHIAHHLGHKHKQRLKQNTDHTNYVVVFVFFYKINIILLI